MTTNALPPEVEEAIEAAMEDASAYAADAMSVWEEDEIALRNAITAACEKAYAAGQAAPAYWMEHRPVAGVEHDPDNGKLHGMCRRCITPWPCEYSPEAQR